ncbi:MAG TPA: Ig-like domain-containing protein [Actinomycetota bacterium]|nr:Ig-like domain-containing protein [Actinomycetota bacterium]
MTEKLGRGDRQRGVARITLVVLALVQAVILMATLSDGLLALAQPNPSASPTASENASASARQSPSQEPSPTGPTIQWLNPSKYEPEQVISDKPDADETYHLVAWVGNRPPGAVVQFTYQGTQGTPNEVTICTATLVPNTNDTYECDWDLDETGTANGSYRLRAILYSSSPPSGSPSGGTGPFEADRDEEVVQVRREAETVEIEYPVNGGSLGVYDPPGPQRAGFVMDVETSDDAGDVRAYYSESPPGTEPSWQNCQQTTTVFFSDGTRRIGCVLQDGDDVTTNITAVAAVPIRESTPDLPPGLNCTPDITTGATNCPGDPGGAEAGDAHRVFPYEQDPAVVELPPPSENRPNQQGNFTCQVLTSTVTDQNGRPIWRVNMDVHAAGPGDEVRFGSVSGRTNSFKAPDQGGHQTENTDTCANTPAEQSSPAQGRHTNVSGPDPKHIESVEGSDTSGRFSFAVRSPAREGTTTVTAWADEDDNDDRQATEPFDTTTVTWTRQTAPPSASSQSPSQSASTATATATATATESATATTPSQSGSSTSASGTSPARAAQSLNCEPETDTNPVGSSHTIVCTVNESSGPASGVEVDVEATGANDTDGDSRNSPDFTCTTTGEGGSCTITHGPGGFGSTADTGTTVYRAWIDADDDDRTIEADATEGVNEFGQPGQRGEPDNTDVVEKTWLRAPLDCSPEQDGNPTGSSHTITCRASQAGGGPVPQGTRIVAEAVGANDPDSGETHETPDFECRTNQEGVCNFTHGPGGNGTTNFEGITRYRAWIDQDNANSTVEADRTEGRDEVAEPGAQPESDNTDVVEKTWTRTPQTLTMEPDSDSASVGSCNPFTITVLGNDGRAVSGLLIDLEQRHERANNQTNDDEPRVFFCTPRTGDGPNPSGVDQTQGDLDPPDESPDNPGTAGGETLTPTDQNGRVTIGIGIEPANGSDGSGTVNLIAFFENDDDNDPEPGEPQDSSTKTWVPQEPRTITCLPETDTNPANTQHVVTCTVRDRFGAPVEGEAVTFTEDGAGDFTSRGARTDANGEVRAVTTSPTAGAQTITATLDRDLQGAEPGEVDECDRAAGTPANAPQGACSDTVSKTWTAATTSPEQFSREVTIEAQKSRVLFNRNVTLSGAVESDAEAPTACTQFVQVNILRDVVGGASEFELFATEQTDANGTFSHSFRGDVGALYVAEVEELAQCEAATSEPEPVLVKVKVSLRVSDSKVPPGKRVRFRVKTSPCPTTARDKVLLFRAIEGKFGKVARKRTNGRCVASFKRRVHTDSVFQARWPKQAEEFLAGKSRPKVVKVIRNRRRSPAKERNRKAAPGRPGAAFAGGIFRNPGDKPPAFGHTS